MTNKVEIFISDGESVVFQLEKNAQDSKYTVKSKFNNEYKDIPFEELGDRYIALREAEPKGAEIIVTYAVEGEIIDNESVEFSLIKRVKTLESIVEELYKSNTLLREAVNNRVSVSTFQAWTRLIEKKTGITLIESPLGYINQELYKNKA